MLTLRPVQDHLGVEDEDPVNVTDILLELDATPEFQVYKPGSRKRFAHKAQDMLYTWLLLQPKSGLRVRRSIGSIYTRAGLRGMRFHMDHYNEQDKKCLPCWESTHYGNPRWCHPVVQDGAAIDPFLCSTCVLKETAAAKSRHKKSSTLGQITYEDFVEHLNASLERRHGGGRCYTCWSYSTHCDNLEPQCIPCSKINRPCGTSDPANLRLTRGEYLALRAKREQEKEHVQQTQTRCYSCWSIGHHVTTSFPYVAPVPSTDGLW